MAYSELQMRAFSQIAYMDIDLKFFDNETSKNPGKAVSLEKLLTDKQKNKLENLGISSEEYNTWSISSVYDMNKNAEDKVNTGFYACVIETSENEAAVAFRGSEGFDSIDNVKHDWVEADIGLVNSRLTSQQNEVDNFLKSKNDILNKYDNLAMTGHSLGGNLAEYATIVSDKYSLDGKIKQCISLDGPGFSNEFINAHKNEIANMCGVMSHSRWSLVGTLLMDLPGVSYKYVQVSNDSNIQDEDKYNSFSRHDTKFLVYDENGNLVEGTQDTVSVITSILSEGVDHMPFVVGDTLVAVLGNTLIGFTWAKSKMVDVVDGKWKLTTQGIEIIFGGFVLVNLFPLAGVVSVGIISDIVILVATLSIASFTYELVYDFVVESVNIICDGIGYLYNLGTEIIAQIKSAAVSAMNNIKKFFDTHFNAGYQYATDNSYIRVNTGSLRTYAQRISNVNSRISNLDRRLDSLYFKVGLQDLWNLMQADMLTGYSWRLQRCESYLYDTANDFESAEREISTK